MKAIVIGNGKSGKAAAKILKDCDLEIVDRADLVVASPGVRVVSELQLGVEMLKKRGVKMLAVTGSKGKSSVVKLLADALGGIPCGNYGLAVSEVAGMESPPEWAVVEVSSFQLETTNLPGNAFEAAAVLNLQDDHLDRHGSRELYHTIKRRLLSFARVSFDCRAPLPPDAPEYVSLYKGTYFDNPVLSQNAVVAIAMLEAVGVEREAIRRAFERFVPLPHRMQHVGTFDGVEYIDDSKATSIAALDAALKMTAGPVLLIAGGLPKGDDPKIANTSLTNRAKKVYTIGQSAQMLADAWSGVVDCEICGTLEAAVEAARRDAVFGDIVLLSPGAASFDQFQSFGERGETFANLVKKGKTKDE